MVGHQGQSDGEDRPFAHLAGDGDVPAVRFGQPAGNGQAQAGATLCARTGLVHAVEAIEDVRQVFGGDANARYRPR